MEKEQETIDPRENAEASAADEIDSEQTDQPVDEQSSDSLKQQLEDAQNKAEEHWNQLVRIKAEMDNLRKRQERDLENAHKFALERFVNELLPVMDSMELGLGAAQEQGSDVQKLLEGSELTLKLFSGVLEKFEVVQVDPLNEPFNPDYHQAMSMQPREDVPPNTVVAVVQKGYTLNGRLVRPAMVMVSQAAG